MGEIAGDPVGQADLQHNTNLDLASGKKSMHETNQV